MVVTAGIAVLVGAALAFSVVGGYVYSQTSYSSFATVSSNPIVVDQQPFISANVRKKDVKPEPGWVCSPPDKKGFMTCLIPVTSTDQEQATDQAQDALRGAQTNSLDQSQDITIINEAPSAPEPSDDGWPWLAIAAILVTTAFGLWGVWTKREEVPTLKAWIRQRFTRREPQDQD